MPAGQPWNKNKDPNAIHVHTGSPAAGGGLPPFSGTVTITPTETGGQTGLWDLDLVLLDGGAVPLTSSATVTFTFKDHTNSTTIASATYNVGDVIGTDLPITESNWTTLVVPYLTGATVEDGATIGFTLYDYLLNDVDDLFSNLVRTFKFCMYAEDTSLPSPTDDADIDYSFFKLEYETEKNGLHTISCALDVMEYCLFDWGDTGTDSETFNTSTTPVTHTYSDATAKDVRIAIPTTSNLTLLNMFSQELNSIEHVDLSSCTSFRLATSNLTTLPSTLDFSACLTFDVRFNDFVTIDSGFDLSAATSIRLGNNSLTSVPSAWDVSACTNLELNNNSLTSLPSGWDVSAVETLLIQFNSISSLPSAWDVDAVTDFRANDNSSLASIPAGWLTMVPELCWLYDCNFSTIPAFDYSACTDFRIDQNSLTTVEATHDFSSMVTLYLQDNSISSWAQTVIGSSVVSIKIHDNSLAEAEVDDVLDQLRTSYDAANRAIVADVFNNVAPSATGAADATYLNGNGCTITHD